MIKARITGAPKLHARFLGLKITSGDATEYNGAYEVTPKAFEETVLETKDKLLAENVRVFEIPYFEATNSAGGSTVYIARKSEMEVK